jgi:hypothetical protein
MKFVTNMHKNKKLSYRYKRHNTKNNKSIPLVVIEKYDSKKKNN